MIKLVFILLSSFWLSCGSTTKTSKNEIPISEEKLDTVQIVSVDTVESSIIEKEVVPVPTTDIKQDVPETPEPTKTIEEAAPTKPEEVVQKKQEVEEIVISKPDHSPWNTLLQKYVNDKGDVNYKAFLNDRASLNEYLSSLAEKSPEKSWSKNEKLAYYINLYNAATVKLILDNYPTKSIKDIKNPWGKDWVKTGDGVISLGDIEHKILRKMNEPRIHFAINCASFSCPKLLNTAFTANQMEAQLHEVTLDFVNDKTRNRISKEKMQLSNIFKWYKKDFTENGSLVNYIKPYTEIEINTNTDIDYLKYDWNLNEAK